MNVALVKNDTGLAASSVFSAAVGRLSRLLGLTQETDPVKVEHELGSMIPAGERGVFSLRLILHGRRVCIARRPRCDECVLNDFCPSSRV